MISEIADEEQKNKKKIKKKKIPISKKKLSRVEVTNFKFS